MIFVGFGFLMTFLRRYGYSAAGFNFFTSALIMLEAVLIIGAVQQVGWAQSWRPPNEGGASRDGQDATLTTHNAAGVDPLSRVGRAGLWMTQQHVDSAAG